MKLSNPRKLNFIVEVIYRHPFMKVTNFHYKYLNNYRISKEQKHIFLPEGFNVNIFNYNEHNQTNELLDFLASDSFIPLI